MRVKYFIIKFPYADKIESKAFGELLRALCNGYYAGTHLFGRAVSAEEARETGEFADEYKIFVNTENEARQISMIIGNIAECVFGTDFIYYDFRNCID